MLIYDWVSLRNKLAGSSRMILRFRQRSPPRSEVDASMKFFSLYVSPIHILVANDSTHAHEKNHNYLYCADKVIAVMTV